MMGERCVECAANEVAPYGSENDRFTRLHAPASTAGGATHRTLPSVMREALASAAPKRSEERPGCEGHFRAGFT